VVFKSYVQLCCWDAVPDVSEDVVLSSPASRSPKFGLFILQYLSAIRTSNVALLAVLSKKHFIIQAIRSSLGCEYRRSTLKDNGVQIPSTIQEDGILDL
jgi:hypothetical protein